MKRIFFLFFALLFFIAPKLHADHVLGGTLGYKYISSNGSKPTYRVTLELYVSCMAANGINHNMNANPEIYIYKSGKQYLETNLNFVPSQSGVEVTPVCADFADQTSCANPDNNSFLGVQKYVYSADFELDGPDPNWQFTFYGYMEPGNLAQVSAYITNANVTHETVNPPPEYDQLYLTATLNDTKGENSSPTFTAPPIPFFCTGKKSYYGMGAADADNDQLKFKLINSRATTFINYTFGFVDASYIVPYTGLMPLQTLPDSFYFNADNGQMIFTPDSDMISLVAIESDEYKDGVLIGTSMRQMCFFIYDECDAEVANTTLGDVEHADHVMDSEENLYLSACEGFTDTVSVTINVSDPNGDNVHVTSDNLPAAAHVTVDSNGTQHPVVHFLWDLTDADPTTYFFYLTYTDDGCPVTTQKNVAYSFNVVPHNIQFSHGSSGSCVASADGKGWINPIGEKTIDYDYKWTDATGNVLRDVHSATGDTITNVPPGTYKVYVRNNDGCGKNILVTVDTTAIPTVLLQNDSSVCEGMPISIGTTLDTTATYLWSTGATTNNIVVTQTGDYRLTAQNHCGMSSDNVTIDFVKCNYCLFVPNAFTPNGDGSNDVFKIVPTCLFNNFKIQIFNRYGQLMFVGYSINDSWDGTYKGKLVDQGTYFYSIQAIYEDRSRGTLEQKGDVILLR